MKLKIVLTKHAQDRMILRDVSTVSIEDIRKTIDSPTAIFPMEADKTQEFRRGIGKKINYVVVQHKSKNQAIVVTTGWTK